VEEYNPEWAIQFEKIKSEVAQALEGIRYISVEHVGSTSVPGLAAKPIIDLSVISERGDVEVAIEALVSKGGYQYYGEIGIPDRHALRKPNALPKRNLYVSVKDCQSIRNQLGLRDLCRNDPAVRDSYGKTKLELSQREWENVDEYCRAKNDIFAWILEKVGFNSDERNQIRTLNGPT